MSFEIRSCRTALNRATRKERKQRREAYRESRDALSRDTSVEVTYFTPQVDEAQIPKELLPFIPELLHDIPLNLDAQQAEDLLYFRLSNVKMKLEQIKEGYFFLSSRNCLALNYSIPSDLKLADDTEVREALRYAINRLEDETKEQEPEFYIDDPWPSDYDCDFRD